MLRADVEELSREIRAYATLAARLASKDADRAALLAEHGLDEVSWEALDDAWQARLSEDEEEDEDGMPALLSAYAKAFAEAQRALAGEVPSFERFVDAARALSRGMEIAKVLERVNMRFEDFLSAQAHWTARMLNDESLAARFRAAML